MAETRFLTIEQVLAIHDDQIERYGGGHGIRSLPLLESAVFRPQTTFGGEDLYETIFDKAAALIHSLIMNHAFSDGNKRTGTVSGIIFLEINGYKIEVGKGIIYKTAVAIEQEKWSIGKISSWLRSRSKKINR